jgi:site-specific DNA-methyltransferase (adenine-specific)
MSPTTKLEKEKTLNCTQCDEIRDSRRVFPFVEINNSSCFPDKCVFRNDVCGVWLYQANCIEFMDVLINKYPNGKFDMIFADPPYFLSNGGITCHAGKMVKVDKGKWDKSNGSELNHEFNKAWISRCQKLLKPNGTIWVSGTNHAIYSVGFAMQQLGMKILNDIIWEKPNPPPNLSCRYFTHSTETIIWAAKNEKSKHLFNYHKMRQINSGKQMKSVWTMMSPSNGEKEFGKHPTQKPVQLLNRIILASTNENDLIFDPFSGSSTTGVAAVKLGRKFVGCEIEKEFVSLSLKRLEMAIKEYVPSVDFTETIK